MITILSIIGSLILTLLFGIFLVKILNVDGAITGLVLVILNSLFAIEFYKLLCTIL